MIEVITREDYNQLHVIIVQFGCGKYAPRYRLDEEGRLTKWDRKTEAWIILHQPKKEKTK